MKRDSSTFKERFQRWKNGELVYENGRVIPHYEDGKDNPQAVAFRRTHDPREQYDYIGYLNSYGTVYPKQGSHYTDRFKLPRHPTFSDESIYNTPERPGGHWHNDNHYEHSDYTFLHSDETLEYLRLNDPGAVSTYKGGIVLPSVKVTGKSRLPHLAGGTDGEDEIYYGNKRIEPVTKEAGNLGGITVYGKKPKYNYLKTWSGKTHPLNFGDVATMANIIGFGVIPGASDLEDMANVANDFVNKDYANAAIGAGLFFVPNILEKPLKAGWKFGEKLITNHTDEISSFLSKLSPTKRAINYAMHLTDAGNPVADMLRDLNIKTWHDRNPNSITYDEIKKFLLNKDADKTKLKQVMSYIFLGRNKDKVIKPHTGIAGIDYKTNQTFDTSPASGFVGPKESVLFGKDMTAGKIEYAGDYGVHTQYLLQRPDLTPRHIYNTEQPYRNGLTSVDDNFITHIIPRTLSSIDDYMPIKTPFGIGSYDAGGHLIEIGRGVDKKYYLRGQDIYKFDAMDYAKKHLDAWNPQYSYSEWASQHPFLNLGLMTVLKSVKPIIVRSRWTPVDGVLDSHLTPHSVKKQIREVYDQSTGSSLMFNVPRLENIKYP